MFSWSDDLEEGPSTADGSDTDTEKARGDGNAAGSGLESADSLLNIIRFLNRALVALNLAQVLLKLLMSHFMAAEQTPGVWH